ncbi:DUF1883 domain-containing protein [Aeromonas hydrophila]|uniref:DUF1883 domain-containing protein n=1 Tax=Aeromonas hydrophila TaxID=644 RepID=UPI003EC74F88
MNFKHYDLRTLPAGKVVEVNLSGNAANVKLMDSSNFTNYKNGRSHHYFGGHITSSITRLAIPSYGHWHLTIDLGGYSGSVRSSVNVY